MAERDRERSLFDAWTEDPVAALAAAAVGAVAGAAIASVWPKDYEKLAGDEAPIRVRNGSLKIALLRVLQAHATQEFQEIGTGRKKWKIKGDPPRGKPEYTALALPSNVADCPNGLVLAGSKVECMYSDGASVTFQAAGNHTIINSPQMTHDPAHRERLEYTPSGEISRVEVDGKVLYKLSQSDSSLQIVLLDL